MKSFLGPDRQTQDSDSDRAYKSTQNFDEKISTWLTSVAMATKICKNSTLLVAAILHYLLTVKGWKLVLTSGRSLLFGLHQGKNFLNFLNNI